MRLAQLPHLAWDPAGSMFLGYLDMLLVGFSRLCLCRGSTHEPMGWAGMTKAVPVGVARPNAVRSQRPRIYPFFHHGGRHEAS